MLVQYRDRQPLYFILDVDLGTVCRIADMQRYLTALAAAHSLHWRHRPLDEGLMFVSIAAPGDGALPEWIDYETSLREEGTSPGIVGNLRVGNSRVDPEEIGFEAAVYQTLLYNGRGEDLLGVWSASYPMAHVPLQQPSTEEWQQADAYDRALWERIVRDFAAQHGGRPAAGPAGPIVDDDVSRAE